MNDDNNVYSAIYGGGVIGEGFSFYGTASYTFIEALNVNETGYSYIPYLNLNPKNMLAETGDMLWNDVFKFGD